MALLTHTIPNLTNGVSQQPITVRLPNQCEEQINSTCRVTDGLSKRNAFDYSGVERWISSPSALADATLKVYPHTYKISGTEVTKNIVVDGATGRIHCAGGSSFTNSYLLGAKKEDIKFLTDDNDVYILNKKKTVSVLQGTYFPYVLSDCNEEVFMRHQGALVVVKNGYFGTTYGVTIDLVDLTGVVVASVGSTTFTPASSSATVDVLQTSKIANDLKLALQTAIIGNATMLGKIDPTVYRSNNCLQIKFQNLAFGDTFAKTYKIVVKAESTTAETAILAMNGETDDPVNLPKAAPVAPYAYQDLEHGRTAYTMKIGTYGEEEAAYYLRYSETLQGWYETIQPSSFYEIFQNMPLKLTVNTLGTYSLSQLTVTSRPSGDSVSNPLPAFANQTINDMFIFNNRLGFLSTNKITLSKIDDFSSFFRTTNASSLASDRVDIVADITEASNSKLIYAVPFETSIMLFGERAQFLLSTTAGFDVSKTTLRTSTEYTSSDKCPPINLGASIYFPVTRAAYSGLYDMSRKDGVGITAEEATHHVPTYIKGVVNEMAFSSTENMLFVRTASEKRTIYVQNRFIRQTILEQNAWHKWSVPNDIISLFVKGSFLYLTTLADDDITMIITVMDLSTNRIIPSDSADIDFTPLMDNRKLMAMGTLVLDTYPAGASYYSPVEHWDTLIGVDSAGQVYTGRTAINTKLATEALWVGMPYQFTYQFSEQVPASTSGETRTVYQYGRLTLRSMRISFSNTAKFEVLITPTGRLPYTNFFTGLTLGALEALIGKIIVSTGVYKFPVNNRSSEVTVTIISNNPYPCTFSTCEWQGSFTNNSGRM